MNPDLSVSLCFSCSQLLRILLNNTIPSLRLNLLKIRFDDHHRVLKDLARCLSAHEKNGLKRLVLVGGSIHTDDLVYKIEDLCRYM